MPEPRHPWSATGARGATPLPNIGQNKSKKLQPRGEGHSMMTILDLRQGNRAQA